MRRSLIGALKRRMVSAKTFAEPMTNGRHSRITAGCASVDVYQGQVLLTGSVKKVDDRTKAEGLARGVKGVRKVFNEIQVTTEGGLSASAKDFAIETKLKANLLAAKGVTSINYRWRSVNGVVYFLGVARSQEELAKVLTLARQMEGVRKVVSHVFIKSP